MKHDRKNWRGPWAAFLMTMLVVLGGARLAAAGVQPGDVITKDNMEKAKDLLCPTQEYFLRNGMAMTIVPYKRYEPPRLYREATEKYASQVSLSPDGKELSNYVAGLPFPQIDGNDPLAAYKVMWNQEHKPAYVDNAGCSWIIELINARGTLERLLSSSFWRRMMWMGRLYNDPKPVVPHDPPITYTEQWGPLKDPSDLHGAGVLNIRYAPKDVPDDSYMYLPELRRVRRLSMANRSDAFWGTDFDIDSIWGFNAKIPFWTFRLLAQKDMLVSAHSGKYGRRDEWCAEPDGASGMKAFPPCVNWEVRKVWVIEGTPTGYGGQYACSKRVMYIDTEMSMMNFQECYDQGGQLWRTWYQVLDISKKPNPNSPREYEEEQIFTHAGGEVDVQTNHMSRADCSANYDGKNNIWDKQYDWYFNEEKPWNTPDTFTVNYLISSGRE